MTDPKSPEQRLEEARREAHKEAGCCEEISPAVRYIDLGPKHVAIDRLAAVAELVGRIRQADIDHEIINDASGVFSPKDLEDRQRLVAMLAEERDRLMGELEKV